MRKPTDVEYAYMHYKQKKMKTLSIIAILIFPFLFSCSKETACIGYDCVIPEDVAVIDSVSAEGVHITLINYEGNSYPLIMQLAEDQSSDVFQAYLQSQAPEGMTFPDSAAVSSATAKVYYISTNQDYVRNNARYVHATQTEFEIVAFSDNFN
ncbi:MAG TPA: hypothetical protein PKL06_10610 [Chitinophagales bacterium]|nr:hypothetical protein [Chitinophagales bacterium]